MSEHANTPKITGETASQGSRSVPMEILALGLCRTGTQSLAEALQVLGYGPCYHMREVKKSGHEKHWARAFEAKYEGKGKAFGRADFDKFLGTFAGVSDVPACLFIAELVDAYPDASIILTTREEDRWFESMRSTLWQYKHEREKSPVGYFTGKYVWGEEEPEKNGKRVFREHNELVMKVAKERGRDVLVYEVKQGWEPLCRFLEKDVPVGVDFPRKNDWAQWKKTPVEKITEDTASSAV